MSCNAHALPPSLPVPHAAVGAERDALHHVPHRGGEPVGARRSAWCSDRGWSGGCANSRSARSSGRKDRQSHRAKAGTPTMGGLLILTAALVPTLLWADLTNVYVWIAVLTTAAFGGDRLPRRLPEDRAPRSSRAAAALQDGLPDRRRARWSASCCSCLRAEGALQHAPDLPVLQAADPGSRLGLPAVRGVRARRAGRTR